MQSHPLSGSRFAVQETEATSHRAVIARARSILQLSRPDGTTVSRVFQTFTATNPTPYGGIYPRVAVYYESNATHNYGYDAGLGIAEEDHGPNFQYDCLLSGLALY